MTTFGISEAAALLGVSSDTVRRWVDAGRLPARRDEHGHRRVGGAELAAFARTQVEAERGTGHSSARNRFRGIVTEVIRDAVMAQVELAAGPYRVVSLMSRQSADELGLEPGVVAVAVIKSTNVVVEVPDQSGSL
ncbi:MAG: helix-turn-helix transcriptional regulator [Nonomuraea sp.]|nr:helix-turn-helix transcriptional regulator [Nonomuraea sp.]NUP61428.1 helix-turn-helix transcriptional regulator [Nonomuraea sp.]NUP80987.1 helix-turn-helix transcriptional regulator [Nonomuraea sp.]NUS03221.1 helix-turn-helix transcriptional regulator [Nonomuraea sp.]